MISSSLAHQSQERSMSYIRVRFHTMSRSATNDQGNIWNLHPWISGTLQVSCKNKFAFLWLHLSGNLLVSLKNKIKMLNSRKKIGLNCFKTFATDQLCQILKYTSSDSNKLFSAVNISPFVHFNPLDWFY